MKFSYLIEIIKFYFLVLLKHLSSGMVDLVLATAFVEVILFWDSVFNEAKPISILWLGHGIHSAGC
jgi:hypothetical protein